MDLVRILIHTAQLKRQSATSDGWGQPALTSAVTVSCFIAGSDRRILGANGQEIRADYEMWVTATTSISINDAVEIVAEPGGQTLLSAGRVIQVKTCSHPTLGLIGTQAFLTRN